MNQLKDWEAVCLRKYGGYIFIAMGPHVSLPYDFETLAVPNDLHFYFDEKITLGQIMSRIGYGTTRRQARGDGWDHKIPAGYTEFSLGKVIISTWNPDRHPLMYLYDELTEEGQ